MIIHKWQHTCYTYSMICNILLIDPRKSYTLDLWEMNMLKVETKPVSVMVHPVVLLLPWPCLVATIIIFLKIVKVKFKPTLWHPRLSWCAQQALTCAPLSISNSAVFLSYGIFQVQAYSLEILLLNDVMWCEEPSNFLRRIHHTKII